ncbi:MAG: AMP-binding protein [Nocardioides sp.]
MSLRPVDGSPAELVDELRRWLAEPAEPEPILIATSGSTGEPKSVALSRRAVRASAAATATVLGDGRWILALSPSYVAGLMVIARSLIAGHPPIVLAEAGSLAEAVDRCLDPAAGGAKAFVSMVPAQLRRILDGGGAQRSDLAAARRLDAVLLGGGPIDPGLRAGASAEGIGIVTTYGATETCGGCVYDGRPLPGVELAITQDGRIKVAGPMLFDGYAGAPALTRRSLVDGWFVTSDVGRLDPPDDPGSDGAGRLRVLGRVDDMVISGGVNVPAPAVAKRLRAHPEIADAAVIGVDDPQWGQQVVAIVVPRRELPPLAEVRDFVGAELPRAWAPRRLIGTVELPRLGNGKLDRRALRALV